MAAPSRLIQERRRGPKPALWILDRLTLSTGELWAVGSHLPNILSAKVKPTCVLSNSLLSPALGRLSSAACDPFLLYLYQQHIFWTLPPLISAPCHYHPDPCTSHLSPSILPLLPESPSFLLHFSIYFHPSDSISTKPDRVIHLCEIPQWLFYLFHIKVKVLTITSQTEHLSSVSTRTPSLTTLLLSHFFQSFWPATVLSTYQRCLCYGTSTFPVFSGCYILLQLSPWLLLTFLLAII